MRKTILVSILITLAIIISCKKSTTSVPFTPVCSGISPKFSTDAGPLITSSCGGSGCHSAGSTEGPGALTSYTQVKNASSQIRSSIVDGSMPRNSTLTTAQKNSIICWIDGGAMND